MKIKDFFKRYYPDILIQTGVFMLASSKFQKSSSSCNPFSVGTCDQVMNFKLILPTMLISFGVNILFRQSIKK